VTFDVDEIFTMPPRVPAPQGLRSLTREIDHFLMLSGEAKQLTGAL
jgi:hypothetical protein